jgi:hypothetical protein
MNQKVFRRLNLVVDKQDLQDIAGAVPGAIERFLLVLMEKIPLVQEKIQQRQQQQQQQQQQSQQRSASVGQQQAQISSSRGASPVQQQQQQHRRSGSAQINNNNNTNSRPSSARGGGARDSLMASTNGQLSVNNNNINDAAKDHEISHLRDSVRLLTAKIKQMEELLKLRDSKIRDLQDRIVELTS